MRLDELKKEILKNPRIHKIYYRHDLAYEVSRMLIEARFEKGFTQERLAHAIGSTQSSIARAEHGRHLVGLDFLQKIAKAYKTYVEPPKFAFMKRVMAWELRKIKPETASTGTAYDRQQQVVSLLFNTKQATQQKTEVAFA